LIIASEVLKFGRDFVVSHGYSVTFSNAYNVDYCTLAVPYKLVCTMFDEIQNNSQVCILVQQSIQSSQSRSDPSTLPTQPGMNHRFPMDGSLINLQLGTYSLQVCRLTQTGSRPGSNFPFCLVSSVCRSVKCRWWSDFN